MSDGFQKAEDDTKLRNATPSRTDRDRELAGNASPSAGQKRKASSIGRSLSPIPEGGSKKPSFGTGLPVPSGSSTGPAAPSLMQPRSLDSAPPAITRPRSPLSSPSKKKVKFPQRFGSGSPRRLKRAKGQNVVRIHAALKEEDLDNPGQGTEPLYVHHFFPNDETWLPQGFYTPKCQIFYHPPTMQIFIKVIKGPDDTGDVEELTSILSGHAKICEDVIGVNCLPEKDFRELLRSNEPPALLDAALVTETWKISSQGAPDLISEVKMARFDQASKDNNEKLKGIWHRIEYLMHWFIQCQGHIWDKGDHNWRLYFAFDNHGIVSAVTSVYEFHAMPKMRHRVGNFLVLPHCQRKGVGTYLLETVYQQALDDPEVMELTVEDPSEGFCVLRDVMYLFTGVRRGLWTTDQLLGKTHRAVVDMGKLRELKIPLRQAHRLGDMVELASVTMGSNLDATLVIDGDFAKDVRLRFKRVCNNQNFKNSEVTAGERKRGLQALWEQAAQGYVVAIQKMRKQLPTIGL